MANKFRGFTRALPALEMIITVSGISNGEVAEIEDLVNTSNGYSDLFLRAGYPKIGDIPLLNRKIFKAFRVTVQEHPYIISVRRQFSHYITGAILTKKMIITVAHPIHEVPIYELGVVAGETYSDRGTMCRSIVLIITHEEFNPYTLKADLAILRLYEEIAYKVSVKAIALISPMATLDNERVFVTGWGRCDLTGKELCLPRSTRFAPGEKIDPIMRTISFVVTSPNYYCDGYERHETQLQPGMLCVGIAREENPVAPCLAVPGAPLVANARLVGLQSWGFGCGYQNDLPLVYTDLRHYEPWILHNLPILRNLSRNNFTEIFQVMKAYTLSKWLSLTRGVDQRIALKHPLKSITPKSLDAELSRLKGNVLDVRDFIYSGEIQSLKKTMIENLRSEHKHVNISWPLKGITTHPFMDKNKIAQNELNSNASNGYDNENDDEMYETNIEDDERDDEDIDKGYETPLYA